MAHMATNLRSNIGLRLGLITFPVNVQSAVISEDKDSKLHAVCTGGLPVLDDKKKPVLDEKGNPVLAVHNATRIKQTIACPSCTREGNIFSFPRGKDNGDGTFKVLSKEELEAINAEGVTDDMTENIALTAHAAAEVDQHTLPGQKIYYLAPGKTARETYPMMVELVKSRPEIAFCTVFAVRSAPAMYRLAVYNDRLALHQLAWPESINEVPALPVTDYPAALLEYAQKFIDDLMMPFEAGTYTDSRVAVLNRYLDNTVAVEGGTVVEAEPAESPLLTLLRAYVEPAEVPKPKAPRKTAAKAPAKPRTAKVAPIKEKVSA